LVNTIIGVTAIQTSRGHRLVGGDGEVFTVGDARFYDPCPVSGCTSPTPPVSPHTVNTFLRRVVGELDIQSGVEFARSVAPRVSMTCRMVVSRGRPGRDAMLVWEPDSGR
jgi:hypothetical protein